jgi:putative ubiquitin-RnfH superfamily antitoxin RatB of RatAB toxin-antitoxin module
MNATVRNTTVSVTVAFASAAHCAVRNVSLARGASVKEAIGASGILEEFPAIDLTRNRVGIHGKLTTLESPVEAGDRIEIYRPLIIDPKQARLARAAAGRKKRR